MRGAFIKLAYIVNFIITALFSGQDHHEMYRTARKEEVSVESKKIIRAHLAPEYDLYNFIRSRFYTQLQMIKRNGS